MKPYLTYYIFDKGNFFKKTREETLSSKEQIYNYIYIGIYSKKEKYYSRVINGRLYGIHLT